MRKCILLSRVSTEKQQLDDQTAQLKVEAKRLGYKDEDIIVIEDKESAIKLKESERHGLNELKRLTEEYDVECVICWEISRIARRQNVLYSIRDYLLERRIQLIVLQPYLRMIDQNGNLDNNASIIFAIFSSLAESEMTLKQERFKRSKDAMREQGKWCGGPVMYGYRKNKDKYLDIYEPEAKYIREIFEKYATGTYSLEKLYTEYVYLGIFENVHQTVAQSRIREILHHLGYSGRSKFYPMIITPELQDRCIAMMKEKKSGWQIRSKNLYFAKGLCRCGKCGKMMIANSNTNIFSCKGYYHDDNKQNNVVNANVLDTVLWECTRTAYNLQVALFKNKSIIEHDKKMEEKNIIISNLDKMIKDIEQKEERAFNSYINGKVDEAIYDKMITKLKKEHDELKDRRDREYARLCEYKTLMNRNTMDEHIKIDDMMNDEEKYSIIHDMIDQMTVEEQDKYKSITVTYKNPIITTKDHYLVYRAGHKIQLYRINEDGTKDEIEIIKRFDNNSWRTKQQ